MNQHQANIICRLFLFTSTFFLVLGVDAAAEKPSTKSYDELFKDAMEAYKKKDLVRATGLLIESTNDYNYRKEIAGQCWVKCRDEFVKTKLRYINILDGQLNFLHYSVKMKNCSQSCKQRFLGEEREVNPKLVSFFKHREPYKLLHNAYTQLNQLDKAVAAGHAYLVIHKKEKKMAELIKEQEGKVDPNLLPVQAMNEPRHITLYRLGELAYYDQDFRTCIDHFEESHMLFFKEMDKCIGLCEEELDTNHILHSSSLYEHYRGLISCRQNCRHELTTGRTNTAPEKLVPLYYDFLQFAYWKDNNAIEAAHLSLSYLYLVPEDPKMINNLKFYRSKSKGVKLRPRQQAVKYYRQLSLESSLIIIAKGVAQPDNADLKEEESIKRAKEEIEHVHDAVLVEISETAGIRGDTKTSADVGENENEQRNHRAYRNQARWKNNPNVAPAKLAMEETELNGTNRVAFDNVIDGETCKTLKNLVQSIAISGDGYQHSHTDAGHPFTEKELFTGITVGKAVEAYEDGRASYNDVGLYFNISEKVRLITQEYFNLERLNIAYTHLVCRKALPERFDIDNEHISHPIHSDNCNINADGPGTCPKRKPAYTWRDYSAILYLNNDFTGGDFIFAHHNSSIQAKVKAGCGRMVAFQSNGIENLHGVLGVTSGIRCALPLWFTLSRVSEDDRGMHEKKFQSIKPKQTRTKNEL